MIPRDAFLEVKISTLEFVGWKSSEDPVDGSGVGVAEEGCWGGLVWAMFGSDGFVKSFLMEGECNGAGADIFVGIHHNNDLFSVGFPRLYCRC